MVFTATLVVAVAVVTMFTVTIECAAATCMLFADTMPFVVAAHGMLAETLVDAMTVATRFTATLGLAVTTCTMFNVKGEQTLMERSIPKTQSVIISIF